MRDGQGVVRWRREDIFYRNRDYHTRRKAPPRTRRLAGENSQSVRVVHPLDLYPAVAEDGQGKKTDFKITIRDQEFDRISQIIPVFRKSAQQIVRLERGWKAVDLDDVTKLVQRDVDAHVNKVVVASVLNGDGRGLLQVRLNLKGQTRHKEFIPRIKIFLSKMTATRVFTSSVKSVHDTLGRNSLSFSSLLKVM